LAIISFVGENDSTDSVGHYVTHAKRSRGYWEIHNDLSKEVMRYRDPEKKFVKPHQIIFNLSEN